jgi:hypothetical protein
MLLWLNLVGLGYLDKIRVKLSYLDENQSNQVKLG